ncbi:hypothetical protein HMPREF1207_00591 [Paenibacillus sp. HGH0039]|nr:hypothetical protein HMPREF1207_00591 [Paenibacillus sp. HGH0039]
MVVFKSAEKPNIAAIHFNTDCFLVINFVFSAAFDWKWVYT